jgi:hypothetical protein
MASTCGMTTAPAAPWMQRAAISTALFGADPQAADASVKSSSPVT